MTVLDDWTEYLTATGASHATIVTRTGGIKALLNYSNPPTQLDLTRHHVIRFLGRDVSPWTRLTYWRTVNQWTKFLVDFGYVADSDLLKGIPRPKSPDPVARPIDDATISRLLAARLSARPHAYVRLALFAALRVHEIAKVSAEDFDFPAGWLMVTGKGGYTAPIPIHPEVAKLAERMTEQGYWFRSPTCPTRPVTPEAVGQTIVSALRSVGSTATAHQLRDTSATRIQRQVRDLRVTQSMLRHRSIKSTQKYCGVADESMRAAIGALNWDDAA